jgi:uncharacterized protein YjbI with pentapeptide repeats
MVGLDFSKCKKLLFSITVENCQLLLCNFSEIDLHEMSFGKSRLKECDFFQSNLIKSDFSGCDLEDSVFEVCDLSFANLCRAINYNIDPAKNKVREAKFSMPEVISLLKPLGIVIEN